MKHIVPVLISLFAVAAGCSTSTPEPDPRKTQPPPKKTAKPEPAEAEESAEDTRSILYHYREGRTRAYLPFESPICQDDETAQSLYEIVALWRFDTADDEWSSIDVSADVPYRISCNAMLDLINVLGFDLEIGTYAIAAEVDGTVERSVFHVGEMACNDLSIGAPPEDHVALCIVGPSSAEARFVPDPAELEF